MLVNQCCLLSKHALFYTELQVWPCMHVWLGVCVCVCLCVYLCKHNHMWTDEFVHVYQTGLGTCQALVRSSTNSLNSYYLSIIIPLKYCYVNVERGAATVSMIAVHRQCSTAALSSGVSAAVLSLSFCRCHSSVVSLLVRRRRAGH